MHEVHLVLPDELLGYFLLHRSAVPKHQIPKIHSHTGKRLSKVSVQTALTEMFRPDSRPSHKDFARTSKEAAEAVDTIVDDQEYFDRGQYDDDDDDDDDDDGEAYSYD